MFFRNRVMAVIGIGFFVLSPAYADSLIEYQVETGRQKSVQPIIIKNSSILVKSAGGDKNLDILYENNDEKLVLIDHKNHSFTPITEHRANKLAQQIEDLQPLLIGIGEQLGKLPPKQRAKWEDMLGGISLDRFDAAQREIGATKVQKAGAARQVAGIGCEPMGVIRHGVKTAEFCLADPAALKLPEPDANTLRALIAFTQRLAKRAEPLVQFGFELPRLDLSTNTGVPVQIREFNGKHSVDINLAKINGQAAISEEVKVPEGYRAEKLRLW